MTKVIVCGGRDYSDFESLCAELDLWHEIHKFTQIIHGAAQGTDWMAGTWATSRGIPVREYPVTSEGWKRLGKKAGHLRNTEMLQEKPNLVIAFPGGRGTADMIRQALAAEIPTITIGPSIKWTYSIK